MKTLIPVELTYEQRMNKLRETKLKQTREKQEVLEFMDYDDWSLILPPPDRREIVEAISPLGQPIKECLLKGFKIKSNHPSGGFFGPKAAGENFRALLDTHPVYIDPMSSLAGASMANFLAFRKEQWNPDLDYPHLRPEQEKYQLNTGIGAPQHFCQDLEIGLKLGWEGILNKIRHYRKVNAPRAADFYDGLEEIVLGIQDWIRRSANAARAMSKTEENSQLRENLELMADVNERLVKDPPYTFREACQWILWYQNAARMYNFSGSLGRLDMVLWSFYEQDNETGIMTNEEAIFHIACLLIRDTAYIHLGGPDKTGKDATNALSYLILEAAHRLKVPANIGVCVGEEVDPNLLRQGVENIFEDKTGVPKFLGSDSVINGFVKDGNSVELARQRAYSGCHWYGLPGREYTLNDCVKIIFGNVFDVAFRELMGDEEISPSMETLWEYFEKHLGRAIDVIKEGLDFHLEHMHEVFPELVLDLCCYGPIEKGLDATHGGVEYYNMCIDGAGLATVADSFAAIEERIEKEERITWAELLHYLDTDWAGAEGERARLMMKRVARYGSGGSCADAYGIRIAETFTRLVKEKPTPAGYNTIPGLFSWALNIAMGKNLGATPNGRHAGESISHGANPDPGYRKDGAPTAMAVAVASVQPGYGNTAPMQIDMDPVLSREEGAIENISSLIKTHFELGGTQINMNVMDVEKVLEAHKDPSKYPDLVVRVTGFSAYFASLSPQMRQFVVDRIIAEG